MTLPGLVAAKNLLDVENKERAWDNLGSNVSVEIPIPAPSLDLNFAKNKTLIDDVSGNNLITFSRASSGTFIGSNGLVQTAASGVPRFDHNGATGESLGLLVEEARTNALTYSTVISAATWSTIGAFTVLVPNAALAPDGTFTATKCTIASTATLDTRYQLSRGSSTGGGGASTFSFFAKKAEARYLIAGYHNFGGFGGSYFFDFDTVTTGNRGFHPSNGATSASMTALANGWYRCSISIAVDNAGSICFYPTNTGGSPSDGTSGVFLWGVQTEVGAFPTSYIPTVASTVTRAADVVSITGANFSSWFNSGQFTLFADYRPRYYPAGIGYAAGIWGFGGSAPRIYLSQSEAAVRPIQAQIYDGTNVIGVRSGAFADLTVGSSVKVAFSFGGSSASITHNGLAANTGSGSTPNVSGIAQSTIGDRPDTTSKLNGTIARLAYYPVRISDLALQYLTSGPGSPSSTTYPYAFTVKGKDTLALNGVSNASTRDFVFIKGLGSPAQPRLTTAARQVASGTVFQSAAMLKASPTTSGNYLFSSGLTLSGVSTRINNTPALSIATSPFSGSTATVSILLRELQPQANWRITEPMPSGALASPEFAIPFETSDFVLFMKAGQN
jgi:hypothetical protein